MSDVDEKLIVKLGQRITEQTQVLRMIAASLQGVEAPFLQMAISSNPCPSRKSHPALKELQLERS